MSFPDPSGLPNAYRRALPDSAERLVFAEGTYLQGANLNELAELERRRSRSVGNMVAKNGDRIDGADAIVVPNDPPTTATLTLAAGRLYIDGRVRSVAARTITGVSMTGDVLIGVRLVRTYVTHEEDPTLLGPHPGSEAEGEPGAALETVAISWALASDGQPGEFYQVYLLSNSTIIDQTPPPVLSGVQQVVAIYDSQLNGNYIVDGCVVTPLGKIGGQQVFSISAGTANVRGFKRTREASSRFAVTEEPDIETVTAEPQTFTGPTNGSTVVTVARPPIASVLGAIVVKRVTETVTRGAVVGGLDPLGNASVVEIETVSQGAVTFVQGTDYVRANDSVSWAPNNAEPANGSTYTVTYLYNAAVTPTAVTDTTLTVSGGVNGRAVLVSYTSKVPRIDLICLDDTGQAAYVKGIAARRGRIAPITPTSLLKLCEVDNNWLTLPTVTNNGTYRTTQDQHAQIQRILEMVLRQMDRFNTMTRVRELTPVAAESIFTDNLVDDFYRDAGAAQTAAIVDGSLQLAVDVVQIVRMNADPVMLASTPAVAVRQDLKTACLKINPYANFTSMPAALTLNPPTDFWTQQVTTFTSPVTREIAAGLTPAEFAFNEVVDERSVAASTLRSISVAFTISGFAAGENLATLTFDGIDVKPPGTQTANGAGVITGTFTIPSGVPVGRRRVRAVGAASPEPSFAEAIFAGEGTIDIATMRRVTLVQRQAPPAVAPPIGETGERGNDPLAQTFSVPTEIMCPGVDAWICAIGNRANGVRVNLVTVENGIPTTTILAEAFIPMATPQVGDLIQARWPIPVYLVPDREYAFVWLTDDATHSLSAAVLGQVDPTTQVRVAQQAYTVGVALASSNRSTWTPLQETDLAFRAIKSVFSPTTRTVDLWTGLVTDATDFQIRAAVELPNGSCSLRFEIVRAGGAIIRLAAGQTVSLTESITETITVRAVLSGSADVSPILYPGATLLVGRIRTTGTYITRAFNMGTSVTMKAIFAALLPAGSGVTVDVDNGDNNWQAMTADGSITLSGGWSDRKWRRNSWTAATGRLRISMTGGPGARPAIAGIRAYPYI